MTFRGSTFRRGLISLQSSGIRQTVRSTSMFVAQRFGLQPDLVQHRYSLGRKLSSDFDHTIRYGPFRGTRLIPDSRWSAADRGSMLLGLYEQEVLEQLQRLSKGRRVLVDVGAADGYYAVGALRSGLFEHVVCFEIDPDGRRIISEQARGNGVSRSVTILGEATKHFFDEAKKAYDFDTPEAVILMDIEGGEFSALSEAVLQQVSGASLIVEIHDFGNAEALDADKLLSRLSEYFRVSVISQSERNPNGFSELAHWSDDDRWLLCSESRRSRMRWFVCEPR